MENRLLSVLARLHARMTEEDTLRNTLPREEWLRRRPEMMLAIGEQAGRLLNLLVKTAGARALLEIGTSVGYSTLWLAEAARTTGGRVVSLDVNPAKHAQARANLAEAGLEHLVELITGDALAALATLPGPFDFVLLDAERDMYGACFEALRPRLAPGALVAADNMTFPPSPHAGPYQEQVRSTPGFASLLVPIGNGVELSRWEG